MKLNGSQILLETLLEQGTDTIFGYPGGAALNIYDELYKYSDRIRHVLAAHEQGASHAADGYARATGKVGVVLATSGPGATNLVTGIATAFMDSIPLIAITANVGTNFIGRDSFQEIYIAGVTMPITKHNFVVRNVEELADTVRQAYEIAISGRPGPVLIDIPKDVTAAVCEFEHKPAVHKRPNPKIQHEQISKMAEMVNAAERPVILFGGGVISSDACELLLRLMKRGDIPACHSLMGIGALDKEEPLNLGLIGMHGWVSAGRAVDNADLVIALGTRFSDRVATKMGDFASAAKVVQVDIDESEVNKNIAVEHSVIGDVHDVLEAVLPLIDHADHTPWKEQIASWKERMDYKPKDNDAVLRPHQLMKKIDELIGKDDIVATDVGQHQMWAAQFTGRSKPRTFLTSGGLGTMGFGLGAAMGAAIGCPEYPVVLTTGDGCFRMNCHELSTVEHYGLPVIICIFDNRTLGMVRQWQNLIYHQRYSQTDLDRGPDFVKLAEAYGIAGYRVTNQSEFEAAFKAALDSGKAAVIDCMIDKDAKVHPMVNGGDPATKFLLD